MKKYADLPVFLGSVISIVLIILTATYLNDSSLEFTNELKSSFLNSFGWVFVLCVIWVIAFMIKLTYKHGDHIIGGSKAEKEFSTITWISMLFSAGLGTGLLYSGTFEPMSHFFTAPHIQNYPDNIKFIKSLEITFFHWGLPAWFIYSATGLIFALTGFSFQKNFQFSRLIEYKSKTLHASINVLAILSILIGVVSTFAIAARQINAGLSLVFPSFIEISVINSSFVIALITVFATLSVLSGLKRGIKILSQINIFFVLLLFFFVLFHVHIGEWIGLTLEVTGLHLNNFIQSLTYSSSLADKNWIGKWTMLYWAWWGAWAPFVGLFIARISRGRTIKEFFLGTIIVPTLICFAWFSLFGFMGYKLQMEGLVEFNSLLKTQPYLSMFAVLKETSLPTLASFLAVVCVTIFYVTSSDSGSYVVDMIASGGKKAPHPYLKVFWSFMEGLLAFVLFYFGGVYMIQNLVILFALPTLLYVCFGIFKVEKLLNQAKSN